MTTTIKCPKCGNEFEPGDSIREEVQKELRSKMMEWQKEKQKEMEAEKALVRKETEESLRKSISGDFENKLRILEQNNRDSEEKLKQARIKELEFMKKEQALISKEQEIDLQLQKMLIEERQKLAEIIRKEEAERNSIRETEYQLKLKEKDEKIEAQNRLVDEMKRKAEQGSMQLQGEAQELALEEMLRSTFPYDEVQEVGKGVRGADCIQVVRNNFGQDCGKIIYESKRTKDFSNDWIDKLKADMRSQGADIAVIVTQAMPKDMQSFGEKDGVWICSFAEVRAVAFVLRDGVIRVSNAARSQENKGDKMNMLYDYLTSNEFGGQWKAVREGFLSMKQSIQRERDAMEKLWKAREKQLDKVLLNAAQIHGSIEGIAGQNNAIDFSLDDEGPELIE